MNKSKKAAPGQKEMLMPIAGKKTAKEAAAKKPVARQHRKLAQAAKYPETPDGRYFVVRGRLWRMSNPGLGEAERTDLVVRLMKARRAVRDAKRSADLEAEAAAHNALDEAKRALGERGPVWWDDTSPDLNRRMAKNTPYADWYAKIALSRPGGS